MDLDESFGLEDLKKEIERNDNNPRNSLSQNHHPRNSGSPSFVHKIARTSKRKSPYPPTTQKFKKPLEFDKTSKKTSSNLHQISRTPSSHPPRFQPPKTSTLSLSNQSFLSERIAELTNSEKHLKTSLADKDNQLQESFKARKALDDKIQSLEQKIKDLNTSATEISKSLQKQLESSKDQSLQKIEELETQKHEIFAKFEQISKHCKLFSKVLLFLDEKSKKLSMEIENLETENMIIENENNKNENLLQLKEKQDLMISSLQLKLEEANKQILSQKAEIESNLNPKLQNLEKKVSEYEQDLKNTKFGLEKLKSESNSQIQELTIKNTSFSNIIQELSSKNLDLETRMSEMNQFSNDKQLTFDLKVKEVENQKQMTLEAKLKEIEKEKQNLLENRLKAIEKEQKLALEAKIMEIETEFKLSFETKMKEIEKESQERFDLKIQEIENKNTEILRKKKQKIKKLKEEFMKIQQNVPKIEQKLEIESLEEKIEKSETQKIEK